MRLTLRTLLAYLDDTLPAHEAKTIGEKVAESPSAKELIDRIRKLTRKRGLAAPADGAPGSPGDPNVVSDYLSDTLFSDEVAGFEDACLNSDVNLAEVASCHQILTLLMSDPVRVPPTARRRMYKLVPGPAGNPNRKAGSTLPIGGEPPEGATAESFDADATLLLGVPALAGADTGGEKGIPRPDWDRPPDRNACNRLFGLAEDPSSERRSQRNSGRACHSGDRGSTPPRSQFGPPGNRESRVGPTPASRRTELMP